MQSCQKLSLDDAEAAQIKLHPLLLLNYSQFVLIGGLPLFVMLGLAVLAGYVSGFWAFVLALVGTLFAVALALAIILVAIPFVLARLQTRQARLIAGGVAAVLGIFWIVQAGIAAVVWLAVLLLPFAQSSVVCRLKPWPTLAVAIVMWTAIAVTVLGILLYATDLNVRGSELILLILGIAPPIALGWSLASRYLFISRISDQTRSLLQAHFRSVFSLEALRVFAGVPPVWSYLQSNKKLTLVLFLLTSLFNGLALVAALALINVGTRAFKTPGEALLIALLTLLVAFPILALLMQICDRAARAKTKISAGELIATDTRKPVLFLRAFADDQVALPPASLGPLGTVLSLGRHRKSFDELLLEEGTIYGPVVALGNPQDKVPPYGVARGYFQNTEWKKAVSDLARDSVLIVLCIDDTDSVWWEVEHIFHNGYAEKTLFVLPPKHRLIDRDNSLLPRLIQHLPSVSEATLRDLVEACSRRDTIAVSIDPAGSVSIASSQTFSGFAYLALLRWFLRSRLQVTVAEATFAPVREPVFARAEPTLAGAAAGAAGKASFAEAEPDTEVSSRPAWMKYLHMTGARMGLLGALVVGLIEGLYLLVRHLAPKVRATAQDWKSRAASQAQGPTYAAAQPADARQPFDAGEHSASLTGAIRKVSWPDWATRKNAIAGAGVLTAVLFLGWLVVGGTWSTRPTSTAFTPAPTTPAPTAYKPPPAPPPAPPSSWQTPVASPNAKGPVSEYERLYRDGYVFDPNNVADFTRPRSADERCMTTLLNATLAYDSREKRRQNYLVVKDCTEAIRKNPRFAEGFAARGQAYKDLSQRPAAIADFRKALALDPTLPGVATHLDELQEQQRRSKQRGYR